MKGRGAALLAFLAIFLLLGTAGALPSTKPPGELPAEADRRPSSGGADGPGLDGADEFSDAHRSVVADRAPEDVGAPPGYGLTDPAKLQPRGPIYVGDDSNFTAANGVRSGNGTPADPYVIRDWSFDGDLYPNAEAMIRIERTGRHVVIENIKIANLSGSKQWAGIEIGEFPDIVTTRNVTIRHIAIESQHAYGIAVREGSHDVRVEANDVRLNATKEWVYGAVAMRGTHNVTFYGNYVDAYTEGRYRTVGIHLSDFFVGLERAASGLVADRNTVANATAGGIMSESSTGTIIRRNLVFTDYPSLKTVAWGYPRGILTAENSNETIVAANVIHTVRWGIQVGSDRGRFYSNTIHDVDYAVYVLDNDSWGPDISSWRDTIFDTEHWNVANRSFRLPSSFNGTLVDLGPGIRPRDFTPVQFVVDRPPSRVAYTWSGFQLNLTVTVGSDTLYDTVATAESMTLNATWTGPAERINITSFLPMNLSFQLVAGVDLLFEGAGFAPNTHQYVDRWTPSGVTRVLETSSTSAGDVRFTLPPGDPSTYFVRFDATAPKTTDHAAGAVGANGWYTSVVEMTLAATDDVSGVHTIRFRIDGGAWQGYSAAIALRADGSHTLEYFATDEAGNNEATNSHSIRIDRTAPVLGDLTPSGTVTSSAVAIAWSGDDATSGIAGYEVTVDGGPRESIGIRSSVDLRLSDGDHVVTITATDMAGNQADSQVQIRVNTNVFSLSGPFHGIPSIAFVAAAVAAAVVILLRHRGRRSQ